MARPRGRIRHPRRQQLPAGSNSAKETNDGGGPLPAQASASASAVSSAASSAASALAIAAAGTCAQSRPLPLAAAAPSESEPAGEQRKRNGAAQIGRRRRAAAAATVRAVVVLVAAAALMCGPPSGRHVAEAALTLPPFFARSPISIATSSTTTKTTALGPTKTPLQTRDETVWKPGNLRDQFGTSALGQVRNLAAAVQTAAKKIAIKKLSQT